MANGPTTNRRFSRRQIRNAITIAVAMLLIFVIGGGGWFVYSKMSSEAAKAQQEKNTQVSQSISNVISGEISQIESKLQELAKSDETKDLLQNADDKALSMAAVKNLSLFQPGLKLRYIKPGEYELDDATPPLTYASIAMLNKAETSNETNIEVLLFGTPKQHIVLLKRVVNESLELIGFVHLSVDVALFESMGEKVSLEGNAYTELVQRAYGKDVVLFKIGDSGSRQGDATTASVPDTRWVIAYWSGSGAISSSEGTTLPLIPILVVLIIIGLGGLLLLKMKGGKGSSDEGSGIVFEGAVRAIAEGAHAGVEQLIPHLPKAERITANLKPLSQGLSTDDATMISAPSPANNTAAPASKPVKESEATPTASPESEVPAEPEKQEIPDVIFRAYDIRGVVGETLTKEAVYEIAKAIGTKAHALGQQGIAVGRDGRNSSTELSEALISGLKDSGRDVIDVGLVPTPVLYFATHHLETGSGVMITGSHNAPEYNGLKIMLAGNTLSGDDIKELQSIIKSGDYTTGQGDQRSADITADYVRRISEDIPVALGSSLKIVVDSGNGATGILAPQLLNAIGHDVVEMNCEIDGSFPNHHPDPSQPENLQDLIARVKSEQADIGFAFDGDGDRLGVVDSDGNIIWPDRQLMLLAKDVLSRNQGAQIIFDVKCSRYLKSIIESSGGQPLMWKTGHSFIKSKMKEVDAPLAGEMSGHIFFKERWYGFDDAIYTAARFIEIFTNNKIKPNEAFAEMPEGASTHELRMPLPETDHEIFMGNLIQAVSSFDAELIDIDGVRIEFSDGWGLARPSNTSPYIILRFEGESEEVLERIKSDFKAAIQSVKSDAELPF